jgi:hypothetical protein
MMLRENSEALYISLRQLLRKQRYQSYFLRAHSGMAAKERYFSYSVGRKPRTLLKGRKSVLSQDPLPAQPAYSSPRRE